MYLRVEIPKYRHTDDNVQKEQNTSGSDFLFPTNGASSLSDHVKNASHRKGHVLYQVEVVSNNFSDPESADHMSDGINAGVQRGQGRVFQLEKRYSAFLALHNELRKHYATPEFPPKKIRNSSHKVLGTRRQQLEKYMQYIVRFAPVPKVLMEFLQVSEQYSLTQNVSNQGHVMTYSNDDLPNSSNEMCQHQAVLGFKGKEPFLYDPNELQFQSSMRRQGGLPDMITQATLDCFYNN